MRIERDLNKMSRGVTQLAYVGDANTDSTRRRDIGLAVVGGALALWGGGISQLAGAVVAGYGIKRLVNL